MVETLLQEISMQEIFVLRTLKLNILIIMLYSVLTKISNVNRLKVEEKMQSILL